MALASFGKSWGRWGWQRLILGLGSMVLAGSVWAQSTGTAAPGQSQPPAQNQSQSDIPDDPSTVAPSEPPHLAPPPGLPPRTDNTAPDSIPADSTPPPAENAPLPRTGVPDQPTYDSEPTPKQTQPIRSLPPGVSPTNQINPQEDLYRMKVRVNYVEIPVTVKDADGRRVDGLSYKDFTVLENGKVQKLSFFSTSPFELSVAVVLDQGLPDAVIQRVNETFAALGGAFSQYDEVALYSYSSTVSQVANFTNSQSKLNAVFNQMKLQRGANNGVPVLNGPMASGPTVNGIPVGGAPVEPVNTPPREAHVLNDAILRAALDLVQHERALSQRDRTRRKVIFVISDGNDIGSSAKYSDVLHVLLKNEIQIKAIALDTAQLPIYSKLGRLHLPLQGHNDLLPKYTSATGGGAPLKEFTRNAIEAAYQQLTAEARNQYTLGYVTRATVSNTYRDIEVRVDRPSCKKYKNPCVDVFAKDGYYPAPPLPGGNSPVSQPAPAPATPPQAANPAPANSQPRTP